MIKEHEGKLERFLNQLNGQKKTIWLLLNNDDSISKQRAIETYTSVEETEREIIERFTLEAMWRSLITMTARTRT